jgi:phosphatidylglycerol:prolipoprotein diacylglycerol transferase
MALLQRSSSQTTESSMKPLLLEIGGLRFHAYMFMMSVAFLSCTLLASREGARMKPSVFVPPQGGIYALLGALFGAKVFAILQFANVRDLWRAFFLWERGLVFYGGLIGAIVATIIYLRLTKTFDWRIADAVAPYVALGEAIGRIGCFLNGCCWGKVCSVPWGVRFPVRSHAYLNHVDEGLILKSAESSLPVYPTQLYMTLGLVVVCLLLRMSLRRSPPTMGVAIQYLGLYGIVRFTVEFFRGDSARSVFGMTVSQAISLALIIGSCVAYAALKNRYAKRAPDTEAIEEA